MSIICEHCGHRNGDAQFTAPSGSLSSSSAPQLRAALEAVNQGILRQQMYLSELDKQQDTLELKLAQIVYPVLSLPPEITARIFVECLPVHGRVRPSPTAPPLLLAQICRDWRETALNTCELWHSVDVAFAKQHWDLPDIANDGALPIMKTWLSRAKGHHLSLTVRSMRHEIPTSVIPLIASVATQIHTLELSLSKNDFDILKQKKIAFPGLRRLALVSPLAHDSLSIMEHAPSLRNLTIDSIPTSLSLLSPSLTTLEIRHRIPWSSLLDLFRQCPKLLDLAVHVDRPSRSDDPPHTALPYLQSLAIVGTRLDFLTLPALRRLTLSHNSDLLAFIERSRCELEHLAIEFHYSDELRLVNVLRAVPSLTSLNINVTSSMEIFAEMLKKDPTLLAQLTTLRLSGEESDFDYLAFT
ncbi:hypothetical protein DFH06DRAFT_1039284, partial [Mycena polygramma]